MRGSLRIIACLAALIAAGCASDVGDINRVQPNVVDKSIFLPEKLADGTEREKVWYFRPTVTEVPLSAGFAFVGLQGETEKIVWDIQEKMLVAYRAYEYTKGSEEFATRPGNRYRGAPVAAFPITSHFDIQRGYNPATGEVDNTISENTVDRPWYERKYMRVDWGGNMIADFRFPTAEIRQQAQYYVQPTDPDSKDRPTISEDYIDITTKIFAEPETITFEGYGTFPQCYLYSQLTKDCMGQAIKVRYSFLRAHDDSEEYEPLPYDDMAMFKFGYFKTNRYVYDRERDVLEGRTEQYAERFNLWHRSRRKDANGNLVSIPYAERTLRPLVWYVNDQFPKEDLGDGINLIEEAQATNDEWDLTFRNTISHLIGHDPGRVMYLCRNNPVTNDATNIQVRDAEGNIVWDEDEANAILEEELKKFIAPDGSTSLPFPNEEKPQNKLCGPGPKRLFDGRTLPGLNPQIGDLRYNFQYWVPNPQSFSPLGYGPHAADPENGRVISANAFIYGAPLETYSAYTADLVSLINDDLDELDLADGTYLRGLLKERMEHVPKVFRSAEALQQHIRERRIDQKSRELIAKVERGELSHDYLRANLEGMRNGWASQFLITDEIVKAFGNGMELGQPIPPDLAHELNPASWGHPAFLKYQSERVNRLSANNITAADFYDEAIYARAVRMAAQYRCIAGDEELPAEDPELCKRNRFKRIRADLMKELYRGVQLHEIGHTVGLRHNFAGSTDALNYQTDGHTHLEYLRDSYAKLPGATNYWEARLKVQEVGPGQIPLQPTFLVPYNREALRLYPLKELQYSSIMDYSAKPNGDFFGLGKYDRAAINFGYGQLVDVFDPEVAGYPGHQLPEDLPELLKAGERHYTYLPFLFAQGFTLQDLKKGIDLMVKGRRTVPYAELQELRNKDASKAPIEVPYRFCSDEYVAGSSVCYRFDEGPDMYEMVTSIHDMYENLYWFNNFKRGRVNFALGGSMGSYIGRIYGRYFDVLSSQYKHFVNDELIVRARRDAQCPQNLGPTAPMVDHYVSPLCGLDQYAASLESLNFFAKVLSRPDVGTYGYNAEEGYYERDYDSTLGPDPENPSATRPGMKPKDEVTLNVGQARFSQSAYDRDRYGYNFYYKPVLVGSWWDKYIAVIALGDPYTRFIGVDANSDVFSYLINFNTLFNPDVTNMVGGLVIEDFDAYAPRIDQNGNLHFKLPVDLYGTGPDLDTMKVLNPDEQYTVRLVSAFLGVAYFSGDRSDTLFTDLIKISVAGMGESPAVPDHIKNDPDKYVEVYDPNSHRTYWATKYEYWDYNGEIDTSVVPLGYNLLKKIKEKAETGADIRNELHFVDILRGILHDWEYVRGY